MKMLLIRRKLSVLERCPYGEVQLYHKTVAREREMSRGRRHRKQWW